MISSAPYPGLRPFQRDEADIFFGREEQTDRLLEKLNETRFVAVVGASGCGKSSLVNAGLVAALETGFLAEAGGRWRVASMRPGNRPLLRLAEALLDPGAMGHERGDGTEALGFTHAVLRRGPLSMVEILRETPLPEFTNLLIVVDQFEEVFRYRKEVDRDEADAFVALLLKTAAQREVPVYVVITMRSDFFGDCAVFRGLPEAINQGQFLAPRLEREELRLVIEGPARVFGGDVEPALVNRLLNDMGADPDQLPLMQHAMMRMWNLLSADRQIDDASPAHLASGTGMVLTLYEYEAVGGLADALSLHADEAYADLDAEGQRLACTVFRALTERSLENRDIRRPATLRELATICGLPLLRVVEVVEIFRCEGRSFFTPSAGVPLDPETMIDISHETLIRQWKRLNEWVAEEEKSAEMYRFLLNSARRWERGEGGLWRSPDLDSGIAWREKERPTPAWAERYGSGFDLALRFLDASEGERRHELAAAEESQKRELKLTRRWLVITGSWCIIATFCVYIAWKNMKNAEHHRRIADAQKLATMVPSTMREGNKRKLGLEMALAAASLYQQEMKGVLSLDMEDVVRRAVRFGSYSSTLGLPTFRPGFAVSVDGTKMAAVTGKKIQFWDIAKTNDRRTMRNLSPKLMIPLKTSGASRDVSRGGAAFSPDLTRIALSGDDGILQLLDARTGKPLAELHAGMVNEIAFSPDGKKLATGGADGSLLIRDAETLRVVRALSRGGDEIKVLAFSPTNGAVLISAGASGMIYVRDLRNGTSRSVPAHRGGVTAVSFCGTGTTFATAGEDKTLVVWDMQNLAPKRIIQVPALVSGISFCDGGNHVAAACADNMVRIWSTGTGKVVFIVPSFPNPPLKIEVHRESSSGLVMAFVNSVWDGNVVKIPAKQLEEDTKKLIESEKETLKGKGSGCMQNDPEKWVNCLIEKLSLDQR